MKVHILIIMLFINSCYVVKRISKYRIKDYNSVSHITIKKYYYDSNHITHKDTILNDKKSIHDIINILNQNKKTDCKIAKKHIIMIYFKNN